RPTDSGGRSPHAVRTPRPRGSRVATRTRRARDRARPGLSQYRDCVSLRLEDGLLDITEVLAVRVERQRGVAHDLDPGEVGGIGVRPAADMARHDANRRPDQGSAT